MQYSLIFDFDGTIADSFFMVIEIYNLIHQKYKGLPILENEITKIRDQELSKILLSYNISKLKLPFVIHEIKTLLIEQIDQLPLIPGIADLLTGLVNKNYTLGVVSSNSRQNITIFLQKYGLLDYFSFIHTGSNLFGKHRVLNKALSQYKLDKENVIYIGDEVRDIEACHKIGLKCIAVTWGYNSKQILSQYSPFGVCTFPQEILRYCS